MRPSAFRQKDVERAIRAVSNTGQSVNRIDFQDGLISIHIGEPTDKDAPLRKNDWDE